jgi:hypothetical protein
MQFGNLLGWQSFHTPHRRNHRFGIGRIAISIGEVCCVSGKLNRFLELTTTELALPKTSDITQPCK